MAGSLYDNDEAMAKLGRDLYDMVVGQRRLGIRDEVIGGSIMNAISEVISEDDEEKEEDEDEDGD